VFRRRQRAENDEPLDDERLEADAADEPASADPTTPGGSTGATDTPAGPWDADDAPDDEVPRVDLGAMHVPVTEGLEMRLDVQDNVVVAATLVDGHSALQVHAFAAPRSSGIWDEVRDEIAQSLRQSGGSADESSGPFGTELHARIPSDVPGQGRMLQPGRFLGVDGPRWFLRGLMTGPAATDPVQARRLEAAFAGVVVDRGGDAMAPRDMLPLRLPKEAVAAAPPDDEEQERPRLEMLERGPEITETR
jgi:Protein of unknown function (DUF3710)